MLAQAQALGEDTPHTGSGHAARGSGQAAGRRKAEGGTPLQTTARRRRAKARKLTVTVLPRKYSSCRSIAEARSCAVHQMSKLYYALAPARRRHCPVTAPPFSSAPSASSVAGTSAVRGARPGHCAARPVRGAQCA